MGIMLVFYCVIVAIVQYRMINSCSFYEIGLPRLQISLSMHHYLYMFFLVGFVCAGHRRGSDDEPKRQPNPQPQAQPGVELAAHRHYPQGWPLLTVLTPEHTGT